jgi:regulatory protein
MLNTIRVILMHNSQRNNELSIILQRIEHFCAYQERCFQDVDLKLRLWKVSHEKIKVILKQLQENKYIDEDRYARSFVRGKFHINKWGRNKIIYELKRKKLKDDLIRNAMTEIGEEDYDNMIRYLIVNKNHEINPANNLKLREKIINFVTGKGFEFSLVEKILTELNITNDYT